MILLYRISAEKPEYFLRVTRLYMRERQRQNSLVVLSLEALQRGIRVVSRKRYLLKNSKSTFGPGARSLRIQKKTS